MSPPDVRTPGEVGTSSRALIETDESIVRDAGADDKRFATCQARAALRGMTLHRIEADDGRPQFIATFHALTRNFANLDELEVWIDVVDGRRERAQE